MVEMRTIGAGGGSIAAVQPGGRLTVGPRSAGARPGPACYGRGGTEPTVTDAHAVLGHLDPAHFLGGAMPLDIPAALQAIDAIGRRLDLGTEEAARGVLRVTNAALASAVRLSLFEKGLDPRGFALLSFGGAGGLQACAVAEELGIGEVIIPRNPGTLSAYGILFADLVRDLSRSRLLPAEPEAMAEAAAVLAVLREEGFASLEADGVPPSERALHAAADLRYRGQAFELLVPWPEAPELPPLLARFHAMHRARFAYAEEAAPVEIVTLRLSAIGRLPKPPIAGDAAVAGDPVRGTRRVAGAEWPVLDRDALIAAEGPAILEESFSTHLLPPGWRATRAAEGALILTRL
jgi:N-methylhydantoinase A/oxoprolinase/acetone carboxylase beta subunit